MRSLPQIPEVGALQATDVDVHAIGISSQATGRRKLLPQIHIKLEQLHVIQVFGVAEGVIPP